MKKMPFVPCVVCEMSWPKPALDKWGVCPICYNDDNGMPPTPTAGGGFSSPSD